ncbi:glycosyltransferase family 4 protein [Ectopseudomonas oleovorans]|uniref:glycosyltransferase family 4 protein n=1 Tax=Ectopseudomonas oleovorans TaxID=301 RepID=UPI000CF17092|nr:glycosyltransferase family 1 protein [Pseudomonas oleovorans]PPV34372.1 glycosyltransferase family 1 protein [Pseudomonas oleovorans]
MKLLINTESLQPPLTGIGTYTLNLLDELHKSRRLEALECFTGRCLVTAGQAITGCRAASAGYASQSRQVAGENRVKSALRNSLLAYRAREVMRNAYLAMQGSRLKNYIYHEPNFILKRHSGPSIATVHDLSFIHFPQHHPAKRVSWMNSELPGTLKRADAIITVSNIVREELIQRFDIPSEKVTAIHLGAAEHYKPRSPHETQSVLQRHRLQHGQYILFVGTLEPRKGVDTLISAWSNLPAVLREQFPLVLAGACGWKNVEIMRSIEKLSATHGLRHLNFVSGEDLPALYSGATLFVYPSVYEGFGLPVLEAMKSAVPVICTADTSMSEITADSASLCRNGDIDYLSQNMAGLLDDADARARLAQAGLRRAEAFSWSRCAAQTLQVYERFA